MNYELAKELKDAGFPQEGKGTYWPDNPDGEGDTAYAPTLEELIEAVMSDFTARNTWQNMGHLHFFELAPNINTQGLIDDIGKTSEWRATHSYGADLDNIEWSENKFGSTPTEAVARLWLALNKNGNTQSK